MRELLNRFDQEPWCDRFSFELIGPSKDRDYYLTGKKHMTWLPAEGVDGSPLRNFLWNQLTLPGICRKQGYDLLFLPAANRRVCGFSPCPSVGTVHDLATLHIKNKYDFSHAVFNRNMLPMLIKRLDHVITVSEFSKADIVRFAHIPQERVTVIPLAADAKRFFPAPDRTAVQQRIAGKFKVDAPYILYISRLEHPGKNHVNLIKAFELYKQEQPSALQLVLPGPDKERAQEIHAVAEASPFVKDIHFLGFIDDADLADLYRGADLFVLPSFFEGFGLPVLEAMSCGTPVITSLAASLPEVSGPHTPHFDPHDPTAIKDAISTVLADEATRSRMAGQGLAWAAEFSWEKTAESTLKVFETLYNAKKRR